MCYIEVLGNDPVRHAGAIIIERGTDVGSRTILELLNDGATVVTASAGMEAIDGAYAGSDPTAAGGGYAEFTFTDRSVGRVIRLDPELTQAMFSVSAGLTPVQVRVSAERSPDEVVSMARRAFDPAPAAA